VMLLAVVILAQASAITGRIDDANKKIKAKKNNFFMNSPAIFVIGHSYRLFLLLWICVSPSFSPPPERGFIAVRHASYPARELRERAA
jgi:hypothetical protein